jgi:hypothetical protein
MAELGTIGPGSGPGVLPRLRSRRALRFLGRGALPATNRRARQVRFRLLVEQAAKIL